MEIALHSADVTYLPEDRRSSIDTEGFWPATVGLPSDPWRDEYDTKRDDLKIVRVAGIAYAGVEPSIRSLDPGQPVRLLREPDNRADPEAVRVIDHDGTHSAGYLPRTVNRATIDWFESQPGTAAFVLCRWVDPLMFIEWDSDHPGSGNQILSMHLILARKASAERITTTEFRSSEEMISGKLSGPPPQRRPFQQVSSTRK